MVRLGTRKRDLAWELFIFLFMQVEQSCLRVYVYMMYSRLSLICIHVQWNLYSADTVRTS